MEHTDLIGRILPDPVHTLVVETPKGEIVLVNTAREPKSGDTVYADDAFTPYHVGLAVAGVAYCIVKFL